MARHKSHAEDHMKKSHAHHSAHGKHHSENARVMKGHDPDRGPPMHEGAHYFDKGYHSDEEEFSPTRNEFPGHEMRGNAYFEMNNEWQKKDAGKLGRSKFSKIA